MSHFLNACFVITVVVDVLVKRLHTFQSAAVQPVRHVSL